MCVELIRLNEMVKQDEFTLASIQEIVGDLGTYKYFSVLDLKDGFFQVDLEEESKHKTGFFDTKQEFYSLQKFQKYLGIDQQFSREGWNSTKGSYRRSLLVLY